MYKGVIAYNATMHIQMVIQDTCMMITESLGLQVIKVHKHEY